MHTWAHGKAIERPAIRPSRKPKMVSKRNRRQARNSDEHLSRMGNGTAKTKRNDARNFGAKTCRGGKVSACKCGNPARPIQQDCWTCHAARMRKWRSTHPPTRAQKFRNNARRYLNVYLERGKVKRLPCRVCRNPKTEPHHTDYSKPLKVVWLCRKHHLKRHGKVSRK